LSFAELQPEEQQPSPPTHEFIVVCEHDAEQVPALLQESTVQEFPSLHSEFELQFGITQLPAQQIFPEEHPQSPGHEEQVSPDSQILFPQATEQSLSFAEVQPDGQHPSPPEHEVIAACEHDAEHVPALLQESTVQGFPSLHPEFELQFGVTQLPAQQIFPEVQSQSLEHELHVSPDSQTPFPQLTEQSLSVTELQPEGQQPSPLKQDVIVVCAHDAEQVPALLQESSVQVFPSLQFEFDEHAGVRQFPAQQSFSEEHPQSPGHEEQVSPLSQTPFPHFLTQ